MDFGDEPEATQNQKRSPKCVSHNVRNIERPKPLHSLGLADPAGGGPTSSQLYSIVQQLESVCCRLRNFDYNAALCSLIKRLNEAFKIHGQSLELHYGGRLDIAQPIISQACRDGRLDLVARLRLLEILELRAKKWVLDEHVINYYKDKMTSIGVHPPEHRTNPGLNTDAPHFIPSFGHGGNILSQILPEKSDTNNNNEGLNCGQQFVYTIHTCNEVLQVSSSNAELAKTAKRVLAEYFDRQANKPSNVRVFRQPLPPSSVMDHVEAVAGSNLRRANFARARSSEDKKKEYGREFLMSLANQPTCRQPPASWNSIRAEYPEIVRKNPGGENISDNLVKFPMKRWDPDSKQWIEEISAPSRS